MGPVLELIQSSIHIGSTECKIFFFLPRCRCTEGADGGGAVAVVVSKGAARQTSVSSHSPTNKNTGGGRRTAAAWFCAAAQRFAREPLRCASFSLRGGTVTYPGQEPARPPTWLHWIRRTPRARAETEPNENCKKEGRLLTCSASMTTAARAMLSDGWKVPRELAEPKGKAKDAACGHRNIKARTCYRWWNPKRRRIHAR